MEWFIWIILGAGVVYGAVAINLYYGYRTLF